MVTYHIRLVQQRPEDPDIETSTIGIKTKTWDDVIHCTREQAETLEVLAKPFKDPDGETGRYLDTTTGIYNPDKEATMSFEEARAMLVNWTD